LRDYYVITPEDERERVLGVCGLGIIWEDLAEIKSLAILEDFHTKGLGSSLVRACLDEAESLGLNKVFTLTYAPEFFKNFGFRVVDKSVLPHKIWADVSSLQA
jgi:N-acetylglutamate synthase and related acetyltransferases